MTMMRGRISERTALERQRNGMIPLFENVADFEEMLSSEFGGVWKTEFVEVRGGFVNVG